ncbi:MAG: AEC family transporter, partial [Saprospiraceae bacterium]|nr:AEC family transporter [Saprospiraceae bacterium]
MKAVIEIVTPVFGLGLLGYIAARMQWFTDRSAEGLAKFVFDWAIPILLIRVLANADLPDTFPWELFSSFYLPGLALYAIGAWIARKFFQRNFMECVISGTSGAYGNTVLLGLPLVILAFGEPGTVPYFLLLSVHGIVFLILTTVLLEIGQHRPQPTWFLLRKLSKGLISNPILIGLILGVVLNMLGWRLPGAV